MNARSIPRRIQAGQEAPALLPPLRGFPVRTLGYLVFLLVCWSVGWLALTPWEVLVEGRGHLTPQGEPVEISTTQMARVASISVGVGQSVRQGDVLLQFDAFDDESELTRLRAEMEVLAAKAEHARQRAEHLESDQQSALQAVELGRQQEALGRRAHERVTALHRDKQISDDDWDRSQRGLLEREAQTLQALRQVQQIEADVAVERNQAVELDRQVSVLETQLVRARERLARSVLRSPVDGIVTSLLPKHAGTVVRPGEPIIVLLPADRPLMARIEIPNPSIRRIREGEEVRIEFDAFPRQDYGLWEGRLERLGPDANHEGRYEAWVALVSRDHGDSRHTVVLRPGLSVTAHIVTEERPLLAELFSPFARH